MDPTRAQRNGATKTSLADCLAQELTLGRILVRSSRNDPLPVCTVPPRLGRAWAAGGASWFWRPSTPAPAGGCRRRRGGEPRVTAPEVQAALAHFRVATFRFCLEPQGMLELPWFAGSTLRGGLGRALRRSVCTAGPTQPCVTCDLRPSCPYGVVFETGPRAGAQALRTHEEVPRPFVLRPPGPWGDPAPVAHRGPDSDRRPLTFEPGQPVRFELILVGQGIAYLPHFILAVEQLGRLGLGRARTRCRLVTVDALRPSCQGAGDDCQAVAPAAFRVFDGATRTIRPTPAECVAAGVPDLPDAAGAPLRVEYLSMTRLKFGGSYWTTPPFHVLFRAALRRLSSLSYFHHGAPLQLRFRELIEEAARVELLEHSTRWVNWCRWSSRQRAKMGLDGTVGWALYGAPSRAARMVLALAERVHVGKNVTFGLGQIRCSASQPVGPG